MKINTDRSLFQTILSFKSHQDFYKVLLLILTSSISNIVLCDWSGNIAIEYRYFIEDAQFNDQEDVHSASFSLQPEYRHQWNNGENGITFIPFLRYDNEDKERTHSDIRELYFLSVNNRVEWLIGINKVFWGVLEFQHLVDIINQTDSVENIDGEDKLGQPMIQLGINSDNGLFELFFLPYFRERTFAGKEGRLRSVLVIDSENALYQSSKEQQHIDYALRWSHYFGNIDIGISWFDGTSREPEFQLSSDQTSLIPIYQQIEQTGIGLQYTGDEWLWKFEAIHNKSSSQTYWAAGAGFEYTFVGINDSNADLGLLMEYHYDERNSSSAGLQNDLFIGSRIALNDVQSTEFLAGIGIDLDDQSRSVRVEASRRIGDNVKINLEAQYFSQIDSENVLFDLKNDSHLQLEIAWYF